MRRAFSVAHPRTSGLRALNYEPTIERIRSSQRGRRCVALQELVADFGSGYASVFSRNDCDSEYGVELLSQSDMFAAEPSGRVIRVDSMPHPERHKVDRWNVLLAGAGTLAPTELYGRAIIADARLAGKYIGQDSLRLAMTEPEGEQSFFAYAYLASPTGLSAIRAASYGTKILRIRRDVLATLPIPIPEPPVLRAVAALVRRCVEQREIYIRELKAARSVIEDRPEMQKAHAMCEARKARASLWSGSLVTLCAWNYAAAGDALQMLRDAWKTRIAHIVEPGGMFVGQRFARVACEPPFGVNLVSQRDVFLMRKIPRRIQLPNVDTGRLLATSGQLLIACDGQYTEGSLFGRIELSDMGFVGDSVTQHILRLVPPRSLLAWTYSFFSTKVGHRLLQSSAVGTSVPMMRHDLVKALPLPDPSDGELAQVEGHVSAALSARHSAEDAEAEAIRIIEEEVLPSWLT